MDGWIYDVRHDAVSIVYQSSPVWSATQCNNPQALLMFSQQSESGNPLHLLFDV
jgi:hypothetical protein